MTLDSYSITLNKIKERNKSKKSLKFVTTIQEKDHQAWSDIAEIKIWKICLGDLAEGERTGLGELLDKGIELLDTREGTTYKVIN